MWQEGVLAGGGQNSRRPGALEHASAAVGWLVGSQRHIGRAGAQRPEHRADRLPAAGQADGHRLLVPDSGGDQRSGDPVAGEVKLGIADPPLAVLDRDRVGPFAGVPLDQLGNRTLEFGRKPQRPRS